MCVIRTWLFFVYNIEIYFEMLAEKVYATRVNKTYKWMK